MHRVLLAAVILAMTHGAVSAVAAVTADNFNLRTVRDLVTLCSAAPADPLHERAASFCFGYIAGAMAYHEAISRGPQARRIVCPDGSVTRFQMVTALRDWASANPTMLDEPAVQGLARAAVARWPCRSGG